jgi:FtsH-binding integral membrane protein
LALGLAGVVVTEFVLVLLRFIFRTEMMDLLILNLGVIIYSFYIIYDVKMIAGGCRSNFI